MEGPQAVTPIADIAAALEVSDGAAFAAREVRVRWTQRSAGSFSSISRRGRVTRATGSTIWVITDGGREAEPMRARRGGLVDVDLLTPLDLAIEVWAAEQPATKLVKAGAAGLGEDIAWGANVRIWIDVPRGLDPFVALSEVEAEAGVLRAWLARRPAHTAGELITAAGFVHGSQYIETVAPNYVPAGVRHMVKLEAGGTLWACRWCFTDGSWDDWIPFEDSAVRLDHVGKLIASTLPATGCDC